MKRLFCILLLAIILPCFAAAETLPPLTLVTPMPSAVPPGTEFSCEAFIVYLPEGMEILGGDAMAGYEAAVQSAFPETAETQLAAIDPSRGAALCFALTESSQLPLEAAREASQNILGSGDSASEYIFGMNIGAGFACSVDNSTFRFYYFSNGAQLLLVSASGLEDGEIQSMLSTLDF